MTGNKSVPTSVKIFGILHIVFASFSLVTSPLGIANLEQSLAIFQELGIGGITLTWLRISTYLSPVLAIALLILGIGLLKRKPWGRSGSIIYAYITIAIAILGGIMIAVGFSGATGSGDQSGAVAAGAMVGAVLSAVLGMIYPILTIVFMSKANVKAAFNENA